MTYSWPVDAAVTQQFGDNPNNIQPNGHTGIDFGVQVGTPVHAADSGNIVFADWASTLSASNPWWIAPSYAGICVVIDHNDGFLTLYAHLSETPMNAGDFVEKGQQIGLSGSTGLSTGPHLHFEVLGWPLQPYNGFYGRLNPNLYCGGIAAAPSVGPTERVVGEYGSKERATASTTGVEGRTFGHGDVLTLKGFVHGENVNGNDVWFVGAFSGTFFHSSAFDDAGTHDLADLTPAAPPAPSVGINQRKVGAAVIRYRKAPSTSAEIIQEFQPGDVLNFSQFKHAENVNGNDVWFKGAISGGYAWSGGFEDSGTQGLTEESTGLPAPAPAPVPTPTPAPVPKYSFTPDFDFVEYLPAALPNFEFGNFPAKPEKVVIHQFGTPGVDTVNSTLNTFTNPNMERVASAHFVVSGKRIVQMVSLKDRAYHAGPGGNSFVGIETDPAQDADTIASVIKLLKALSAKYGYVLTPIRHKEVPQTNTTCGTLINLANYQIQPVVPIPAPVPTPTPTPVPTPTPAPTPAPEADKEAIIAAYQQWILKQYLKDR